MIWRHIYFFVLMRKHLTRIWLGVSSSIFKIMLRTWYSRHMINIIASLCLATKIVISTGKVATTEILTSDGGGTAPYSGCEERNT